MKEEVDLSAVLSSVDSASKRLNKVSNNANAVLRTIEKRLQGANIGFDVWWDKALTRHQSADIRNEETHCWITDTLGFARVDHEWCLAVQRMRNSNVIFEGEDMHINALDGPPVALLRAKRNLRLAALNVMPEFLAYLAKQVEGAATDLEKAASSLAQATK